jgi:bifunctional DNA-binding transcriptional regulator/antitoxin component of YhaV-PrlF toxin-antitoxin module
MIHTIEIAVETGGRLIIPGKLWKALKLKPGTVFVAEPTAQNDVRLTPQSEATLLAEEDGLLVATGETVRHRLKLAPDMRLVVERADAGNVQLRPQPELPCLVDEEGVLVVETELLADVNDFIRQERDRRSSDVIGMVGL